MADNSLQSSLRSLDTLYKTRRAATPTQPWEYEASVNSLLGQNADSALSRARINLEDKTSTDQFNKSLAQAQAIADAEAAQQQKLYDEKMAWEKEQADKTLAQNKAMYDAQMAQNALNLKAQEDAAKTGMISNVGTALAIDYLGSNPGESVVGKVGGAIKDAGIGAYNKLFGPSTPTTTTPPASTPISGTETYWAQNAPDAGGAVTAGLGPELASAGTGMALDVAANAAPSTISLASTVGSSGGTGVVDMGAGWGMAEPLSTAGTSTGSTALGTAGNVLGNAALYYAAGKAVQGIGEKWHDNNSDVPYAMKQWGHNIQDATSLPFYTELGINEGAKTAKGNAGEEYRTYEDTGKGNTALALEGLMPADTGLLGETLRGTIDAAARFNTGDMLMKAGDIMAPMRTVAERAFGVKPGGSEVINYLANPIGEAYHDFKEHVCIIVTACTDRYSPEVEITRQYRDHFLTNTDLRGYYALAEKIVPTLQHNKKVNTAVKKLLVDKLIDYGSYRLGLKNKCRLSSRIISKLFLVTIRIIGIVIPQYTRANGEVY